MRADGVEFSKHRLEAAFHVGAVIAVADRLIERGQFRRAGDDLLGGRLDQRFRRCGFRLTSARPY